MPRVLLCGELNARRPVLSVLITIPQEIYLGRRKNAKSSSDVLQRFSYVHESIHAPRGDL